MSRYKISQEYREEMINPFYNKRKIASDLPANTNTSNTNGQGMGAGFVSVPQQNANMAEDVYFSEGNADYAKDYKYDEDESLDILRGDMHGVIGHAEDPEEYQEDDIDPEADFQEDHFHTAEEEVYQEEDGQVFHEGEEVIEGNAEEVLEEIGKRLPGVDVVIVEEDNDDEEEVETDWENDRDPKHFMVYITNQYPGAIPKHDGTSTLGCERAILFLNKLNKEISEALRSDSDDHLDIPKLEEIRVNLVKDVSTLKNHVKDLNKKMNKKRAEVENNEDSLVKTASTPKIQLVMTPFERAISGIITNAVVSSGKPFEDVYEFLKKKYALDEREELAILQILKDMGHPIFKDRGTIGKKDKDKEEGYGVEFIKNYLA